MRRQRNIAQMKEQEKKNPEKEINEKEITNLADAEFKTVVIRMLQELIEYGNSIKKTQENFKVTLSEIKKTYREPTMEEMMLGFKSMFWSIRKK